MRKSILILCTGNSSRSQMAEGLMRSFDADLDVSSAGTAPAERVHPAAIAALREIGIDIGEHRPKSVDRFLNRPFDFVITVCDRANESCPVFTGGVGRRVHIGFEDPGNIPGNEDEVLNAFRRTRDQIRTRLGAFYRDEIAPSPMLRAATAPDMNAVAGMLRECALTIEGLAEQFGPNYAVAERSGRIVGVAGIEQHGREGLLRSVCVLPEERKSGIGTALVADRLAWAASADLNAVYLLTTTASGYFPRFGFEVISRDEAPENIRASREFAQACPATAILMRSQLQPVESPQNS
jgi:arsenate reductase (thioredoxin)